MWAWHDTRWFMWRHSRLVQSAIKQLKHSKRRTEKISTKKRLSERQEARVNLDNFFQLNSHLKKITQRIIYLIHTTWNTKAKPKSWMEHERKIDTHVEKKPFLMHKWDIHFFQEIGNVEKKRTTENNRRVFAIVWFIVTKVAAAELKTICTHCACSGERKEKKKENIL